MKPPKPAACNSILSKKNPGFKKNLFFWFPKSYSFCHFDKGWVPGRRIWYRKNTWRIQGLSILPRDLKIHHTSWKKHISYQYHKVSVSCRFKQNTLLCDWPIGFPYFRTSPIVLYLYIPCCGCPPTHAAGAADVNGRWNCETSTQLAWSGMLVENWGILLLMVQKSGSPVNMRDILHHLQYIPGGELNFWTINGMEFCGFCLLMTRNQISNL